MKNKPKKPRLPKKITEKVRLPQIKRRKAPEERIQEAFANVPKITNETVAEHREEVLASARKYIYPLQHSRKKIVYTSVSILVLAVLVFFTYIGLALYKFQATSGFIYGVTQVLPLPIAKAGGRWVSYENYLFELRRYMHYYETQQQVNFSTPNGKKQLQTYKKRAMNEVITDAYVKELARQYHVSVTEQQVNSEISMVRSQNRLGSSQQEFDAVLSDFWGWTEADFARELKQQMLQQAVVAKLDTSTYNRAQKVLALLKSGSDFATLAAQYSDDASTKSNGGVFPGLIAKNDPNIAPQITQALFTMKPGQVSGIINTGYTLEIVKLLQVEGGKVQAAHISFNLSSIAKYIGPLEKAHKPEYFVNV